MVVVVVTVVNTWPVVVIHITNIFLLSSVEMMVVGEAH